MSHPIPSQCAAIANEITALEQEKALFQQQLKEAPPSMKPLYIREIRKIGLELVHRRQELNVCLSHNPPSARPDLRPIGIVIKKDHTKGELRVAPRIKNVGKGIARGPFRIDLAVTIYRGNMTTSIVHPFQVPAGVVLYGEMVIQQLVSIDDITWSQEYTTEDMIVPLYYIDENPSTKYDFDFVVDINFDVLESNELNNTFHARAFFVTPTALQRDQPFTIKFPTAEENPTLADKTLE
jgi:hypothetical protein